MNPWKNINLNDYEKHMSLENVYQLQTLNQMMKEQLTQYNYKSIMILGIAGGNGLEYIHPEKINTVYGIDINSDYLEQSIIRFPELKNCLKTICTDLTDSDLQLPQTDLLIADLLIEYIGYLSFQNIVQLVNAQTVSCIIQINTDESFVSDSPYTHVFDKLDEVHHQIEEDYLRKIMNNIDYHMDMQKEQLLPNGKKLLRLDFKRN